MVLVLLDHDGDDDHMDGDGDNGHNDDDADVENE